MAFSVLSIQTGSLNISIMNATANQGTYRLANATFAPPLSRKRVNKFLSTLPYDDLQWKLKINIHANTAESCYTALQNLVLAMHQIEDWKTGTAPACNILYQPQGSTLPAPNRYLCIDVLDYKLPTTFEETGYTYVLVGFECTIITRGLGIQTTTDVAATASDVPTLQKGFANWATHPFDCPYSVSFLSASGTANLVIPNPGTLFLANSSDALHVVPATGTGNVPGWTSVADVATAYAPYNIARFTPTVANSFVTAPTLSSIPMPGNRIKIWILARVNGAGRRFSIQVAPAGSLFTNISFLSATFTANIPTLQYLGTYVANVTNVNQITFRAAVDSLTGNPTLDVLAYIFLLDSEYTTSLTLSAISPTFAFASFSFSISSNWTSSPFPSISNSITLDGSPYLYTRTGALTYVLAWPGNNSWRLFRTTPAVATFTPTFTRSVAYISPR